MPEARAGHAGVRRGRIPATPPRRVGEAFDARLEPVVAERLSRHESPPEVAAQVTALHRLARDVGPAGRGRLPTAPITAAGGALLTTRFGTPNVAGRGGAPSARYTERRELEFPMASPSASQMKAVSRLLGPEARRITADALLRPHPVVSRDAPAIPRLRDHIRDLREIRVDRIERFDAGGVLRPGNTLAINTKGRDEGVRVVDAKPLPASVAPARSFPVHAAAGPRSVVVHASMPLHVGQINKAELGDVKRLIEDGIDALGEKVVAATRSL